MVQPSLLSFSLHSLLSLTHYREVCVCVDQWTGRKTGAVDQSCGCLSCLGTDPQLCQGVEETERSLTHTYRGRNFVATFSSPSLVLIFWFSSYIKFLTFSCILCMDIILVVVECIVLCSVDKEDSARDGGFGWEDDSSPLLPVSTAESHYHLSSTSPLFPPPSLLQEPLKCSSDYRLIVNFSQHKFISLALSLSILSSNVMQWNLFNFISTINIILILMKKTAEVWPVVCKTDISQVMVVKERGVVKRGRGLGVLFREGGMKVGKMVQHFFEIGFWWENGCPVGQRERWL